MEISEKELEKRLFDAGNKLLSPPSSTPELLASLNLLENMFAVVEQSPTVSMKEALAPSTKALIAEELLRHTDVDVKVAVASCISEITRITAPEAPYEDEPMKEVFQLIVSSFEKLDDISSRSYLKRISILETVAKVRSCVVMLDLQCDELIVEMFQHFFRTIRDEHQKDVFSSMETIMTLVVDESEDISVDLLSTILNVLKKEGQEVLPIACQLGENVIVKCASKLKPYLLPAIRSGGASLDDYCKVVTDVCQTGGEDGEPTNGDAANKITADENNLVDAPSEKAVEITMEGLEEAPPSEEVGPSSTASPKAILSNGTLQNDTANSVSANDNSKEADLDMQCEKAEPSKAIDDSVGAEEALECEPKQDESSRDNEQKPNSTKSSSETLNPDVSDGKMDDIDKPNNGDDIVLDDIRCEDPVVDTAEAAKDEKLSEVTEDEKLSVEAKDEKSSAVALDEKLSEVVKDEKLSEVAEDDKLTEVVTDEKLSEAAKDEKLSETAKDEKLSVAAKDEKLSEAAKDEKLSEVAKDEKLSEVAKDEKLSEEAKEVSEATKEEKLEKLSEAAKDEKLEKLSEAAKDEKSEKLSEAAKDEKLSEAVKDNKLSEAAKDGKLSEAPIPSPKTFGDECADIASVSRNGLADETCSKMTEREEKLDEQMEESETARKVEDVEKPGHEDDTILDDTEREGPVVDIAEAVEVEKSSEVPIPSPKTSGSEGAGISPASPTSVADETCSKKTEQEEKSEERNQERGTVSDMDSEKESDTNNKSDTEDKKETTGSKSKVNTSSDKEASSASEPEESIPDSVGDTKTENDNMDESDDNVAHNLAETEVGESSQEETPKKKSVQAKPTSAKSQKKKSAKGGKKVNTSSDKEASSASEPEESVPDSVGDTKTENDNMDESDDNGAHNLAETEVGESSQEETPKKKSVQAKPTSAKSQKRKSAKGGKKKTAAVSKSVSKSTPKSTPKAVKYESDEELLMSNLKRKRSSEGKKTKKVYGAELVGANIKVWWPDDQEYYQGVVESYDSSRKKHRVHYDDGDIEVLNLKDEKWMFVALSEERENNDDGPEEFADETPKGKKAKTSTDVEAQRGKTANSTKKSGASSSRSKATSKSGSKQETAKTAVKVKEEAPKKGGKSDLEKSGKSTKASKSGSKLLDDTPKSTGKSKDDTTDTPKGSNKSKPDTSKGSSKSKGKTPTTVGKSTSGASGKLKTSAHHDDDNSEDESLESERTPEKPKAKSQSASKSQKSSKKRKRSTKG